MAELSAKSNTEIIACIEDYIVDVDAAAEVEIEIARQKVQLGKVRKILGNLGKVEEQSSQFGRVSADRLSGVEMGEGFNIVSMMKQAMQYRKEKEEKEMEEAAKMPVDESLFESVGGQDESKNTVKGADVDGESKKSG